MRWRGLKLVVGSCIFQNKMGAGQVPAPILFWKTFLQYSLRDNLANYQTSRNATIHFPCINVSVSIKSGGRVIDFSARLAANVSLKLPGIFSYVVMETYEPPHFTLAKRVGEFRRQPPRTRQMSEKRLPPSVFSRMPDVFTHIHHILIFIEHTRLFSLHHPPGRLLSSRRDHTTLPPIIP